MTQELRSTLSIAQIGNPILRQTAQEVTDLSSFLATDIQTDLDYVLTSTSTGVALAAPQISKSYRVFLLKYQSKTPEVSEINKLVINPKIIREYGEQVEMWESCLSIPNLIGQVQRRKKIEVEYYNSDAKLIREELTGFEARVFLHEYDHLHGVLFTDKVNLQSLMTIQEYKKMQDKRRMNIP